MKARNWVGVTMVLAASAALCLACVAGAEWSAQTWGQVGSVSLFTLAAGTGLLLD